MVAVVVLVLVPLAPIVRRTSKRTSAPPADWHIDGVASRSLGALVELRRLLGTIGEAGETIGVVAASQEHQAVQLGFREVAPGSLAMIGSIPRTSWRDQEA
ncbi:hypothetical protein [Sanguibacter suaedae]|uniref:Uncharacterized protein n=1 Tax=Sanguibacter suaedae TaxID=2795737 RepID=A0A934MA16_9MICO|nr:hypothetical protein [Sanguibacter suaedae]MBI9115273.1 hypothetical protein [Sanguibacter suaedae]